MENNKCLNKNFLDIFIGGGYHKINLSKMYPILNKRIEKKERTNTIKFEIRVTGLKDPIVKQLDIVSSLNDHNMLQWFTEFEEVGRKLGWSEEEQILVLQNVIECSDCQKILSGKTYGKIKNDVLNMAYPNYTFSGKGIKLLEIKQTNYYLLEDMFNEIQSRLEVVSHMEKYTKNEYERRYNEICLNAFAPMTKDYIMKANLKEVEEITKVLLNLEKELIARIKNDLTERKDKIVSRSNVNFDNEKWCSIHRSRTHNTVDCFSNKKVRSGEEKREITNVKEERLNNKNINYSHCKIVLKEQSKYAEIKLPVCINKQIVTSVLDTGSTKNLISLKEAKRLGLTIKRNSEIEFIFGNGIKQISNKVVEAFIEIENLNINYNTEFRVIDNLSTDIILGVEFIHENQLILNFVTQTIIHGDKKINMVNGLPQPYEEYKDLLLERCFSICEENINAENRKKIQEYIRHNDDFKKIKIKSVSFQYQNKIDSLNLNNRTYTIPQKFLEQTRQEIKRLKKEDIIEYSDAKYSSPAFVIAKKNNEVRLVVDFREIKKNIIDEVDLLPNLKDMINEVKGSKYFSKIDLKNGFNQIPIEESSRELTSFKVLGNIYKYKRVPFGMKSGPKLFQKTMNIILAEICNVVVYIDDILIHSKSIKEHNEILKQVLERLYKYHVKINFEKSIFGVKEIEMVGFIINETEIRPNMDSINKLLRKLNISKRRELQKILGILNWYRDFVPNFSSKVMNLTEKLKGLEQKINLTVEEKQKVVQIINEIKKKGKLAIPIYEKDFFLQTDASDKAIGAVLFQGHGCLGFYSKKLTKTEINYTIVEKEMLAIMKSLEFFKGIIMGYHVTIMCDNRNCLFDTKNNNSRMIRWKLMLNEYNFTLEKIEGKRNVIADLLSRENESLVLQIKENKDDELRNIIKEETTIEKFDKNGRLCIEPKNSLSFVRKMHSRSKHAGQLVMYYNLKNYYYIKNIKKVIKTVVNNCENCKRNKKFTYHQFTKKYEIKATEPFKKVCSDIFGPIKLKDKKIYLLSIIDVFTRYTKIYKMNDISEKNVLECFEKWGKEFGYPKHIITDNGTQYTGAQFKQFAIKNNIDLIYIPKYHPQSNGICERTNGIIAEVIRLYIHESITKIIENIEIRLNNNYRRSIRCAPREITVGKNYFDVTNKTLYKKRDTKKEKQNDRNKLKIAVGSNIYVRDHLSKKWEGPYIGPKIINKISKNRNWIKVNDVDEWIHITDTKF